MIALIVSRGCAVRRIDWILARCQTSDGSMTQPSFPSVGYWVVKLVEQVAARTVTVNLTVLPETAVPMLNCTDPFPAPSVVPV